MIDISAIAGVEILNDRIIQRFRTSDDETICRWRNVALETKFERTISRSASIKCLEILAESSELSSRVWCICLRISAERIIGVIPSPTRTAQFDPLIVNARGSASVVQAVCGTRATQGSSTEVLQCSDVQVSLRLCIDAQSIALPLMD